VVNLDLVEYLLANFTDYFNIIIWFVVFKYLLNWFDEFSDIDSSDSHFKLLIYYLNQITSIANHVYQKLKSRFTFIYHLN